ncbi:MAG TPA: hypothetical protein VNS63_16790, partial [Blastocatellia bacterium]|nr:hypothetical protein [Blastocatellia bacterium]
QNTPPPPRSTQPPAPTPLAPNLPSIKPDLKPAPGADSKAAGNTNASQPPTASRASGPRLILPLGNIDFGNVNQGKSLTRNLVVKNAGKADLNIESVVPS